MSRSWPRGSTSAPSSSTTARWSTTASRRPWGKRAAAGRAGVKCAMNFSSFQYLVKQGWHNMVANRLMTLASIGVLAACLIITGVAALLSVNVTSFVDYLATNEQGDRLFHRRRRPGRAVEALDATQIPAAGNVATCEYISKAQAVEDMQGLSGRLRRRHAGL
ncbi:MAG: hypothetical protein V8T36_07810 [Ruthenibacterium lactatiformans]